MIWIAKWNCRGYVEYVLIQADTCDEATAIATKEFKLTERDIIYNLDVYSPNFGGGEYESDKIAFVVEIDEGA